MKHAYQETKEKAVHSVYAEEYSSTEYASEVLEQGEEKIISTGNEVITKVADSRVIKCKVKKGAERTMQGAGTYAKKLWQRRKQIEIAVEKISCRTLLFGEKASLLFSSSLKWVLKTSKEFAMTVGLGGTCMAGILLVLFMIGAAFLFFGDGVSTGYSVVSAEVEQYDQLIRLYAKEYEMMDYVDLVKAVMMQESGGEGSDPMQASEGSFNTRYPKEPNGITDPEYSISCGIQELKVALEKAAVESPIDLEKIKLALQGYNMGSGYILWALEKDGGYTASNAIEFSEMMAEKLGWESYGDIQYVPHVLQYYPFTGIASGNGKNDIVEVALSQVGNVGGRPYWSWYGFSSRVEWCACFVSWCANECGYIEDGTIPKFSYCQSGANWFKAKGRWQSREYIPKAGDIIFFDWEGDGHTDHVGIVEKCDENRVYTIEGNNGNEVKRKNYPIRNLWIYGYVILE